MGLVEITVVRNPQSENGVEVPETHIYFNGVYSLSIYSFEAATVVAAIIDKLGLVGAEADALTAELTSTHPTRNGVAVCTCWGGLPPSE